MTKSKFQNPNQSFKAKSLIYWDLDYLFEICHLDLGFLQL